MIFILLIAIVGIVGGYYFSYQFAKYYLVNYILNGKIREIFSREFLIVVGLFIVAFSTFVYFAMKEPGYFEQGVDQLHKSSYVRNKIGDFNSYRYKPDEFPKKPGDTVIFQIELWGPDTLYLTCSMKKTNNNWRLIKIRQDSVHKSKN